MIERMLTGGGVSVGESYEAQENGKTIIVRSIGPTFQRLGKAPQLVDVIRKDHAKVHVHELNSQSKGSKSREE